MKTKKTNIIKEDNMNYHIGAEKRDAAASSLPGLKIRPRIKLIGCGDEAGQVLDIKNV